MDADDNEPLEKCETSWLLGPQVHDSNQLFAPLREIVPLYGIQLRTYFLTLINKNESARIII